MKKHFIVSIITYMIIYIIVSFIEWDLTWIYDVIIEIPSLEPDQRAGMLFIFVLMSFVIHIIINIALSSIKDSKKIKLWDIK